MQRQQKKQQQNRLARNAVSTLKRQKLQQEQQLPIPIRQLPQKHHSERDILVGRGMTAFSHVGNRRYRTLIDMHLYEYHIDGAPHRRKKTATVQKIVEILLKAGYRFLRKHKTKKIDPLYESPYNEELNHAGILNKVGHSLRDRLPLLHEHLARKLKTRVQLEEESIPIMDYIESVVAADPKSTQEPRIRDARAVTEKSNLTDRNAMVKLTQPMLKNASLLLRLKNKSSTEESSSEDEEQVIAPPVVEEQRGKPRQQAQPIQRRAYSKHQAHPQMKVARRMIKRCVKPVQDIVVPTMTHHGGKLPIAGSWKFYPSSKISAIDLGPGSGKGWTLKLTPIEVQGEPITLSVQVPQGTIE